MAVKGPRLHRVAGVAAPPYTAPLAATDEPLSVHFLGTAGPLATGGRLQSGVLLAHRHELTARRIILTHLGPEMAQHVADAAFEVAADGLTLTL